MCVNTCKAAAEHEGKAQRELLEKYKQGVAIKKQYIEEATSSLQNKAFELENANKEMDQLNAEKTLLEGSTFLFIFLFIYNFVFISIFLIYVEFCYLKLECYYS